MKTTLYDFIKNIASCSYEYGEYAMVRNSFKDNELKGFIDCFLTGTEIVSDGSNGSRLSLKGKADDNKGATGDEIIYTHHFQIYDYSEIDGSWYVVTCMTIEEVEKHLLSEAGYLNYGNTQILVFEDGVEKPFEVLFKGDFDTTVVIDKDAIDAPLNIKGMQDKLSVRWIDPEELLPLTDEEVQAYKDSLKSQED